MKRLFNIGIPVIFIIGVAFYLFTTQGKTPPPDDSRVVAALRWVDTADADRDVKAAIYRSDMRFLEVGGYAGIEPGIPGSDQEFAWSFGKRFLEGTSDFLLSKEHRRLNSLAISYARKYNTIFLKYLRTRQISQTRETSHPRRK